MPAEERAGSASGDPKSRQGSESRKEPAPKRVSEADFLEMANVIGDVFWIFDWQKQEVVYVSPAFEVIWGRPVDDLYKCYGVWEASVHPEDRESAKASFAQVVETGGGEIRAYRIMRPDRTVRWVSDRAYPVYDEQGRVCRVVGVVEDITEHQRAEECLRESELRLRTAVESLPFDFFMLDNDGCYVMVNSVARANWGIYAGQRPEEVCPDEATLALWRSNNRRAFAGEVVRGEVQMAPQGKPGHYYNIVSPIRSGDEIRGILGVNIDITARKEAEGALRQVKEELEQRVKDRTAALEAEMEHRHQVELDLRVSEEKYRTLVENAGDAISTVTEEGVYLFANRTTAQDFQCAPEEIVGKTMWDFFAKPFVDDQIAHIREAIRTGRGSSRVRQAEIRGQRRWFSVTVEPLRSGSEDAVVLVIARDVDDLVQAHRQLEEYRAQMTRADRLASLGTMSAMVAHELTQPLTVLRLSLQNALAAIKTGAAAAVVTEDLEISVEETATMAGIIERFRGFARASSPGRQFDVDLSAIARHMVDLTAEAAKRARVSVSLHDLDRLPRFSARAKDMEQVFFALLMNAIQAADGVVDRTIVVSAQTWDSEIELSFADNCGGIAAEHVDQIFKPFFTTKGQAGGTGLGLCVVEHILDRYRAKIEACNRPGEGVTFKITLPLSATASA